MLSTSCHLLPLYASGWQLARTLVPIVNTLSARWLSTTSLASAASPAPLAEHSTAKRNVDISNLARFNPEAGNFRDDGVFAPHHTSQRFSPVLSLYRSQYPDAVWTKIATLFPKRVRKPPLAIDVAVGGEGRAGVELAKRGFRILSVGGDALVLGRTLMYAAANNAHINLITAKAERKLVHEEAADLVTCMHGLHLLDPQLALQEIHRILKPGGRLVVGWNDRDLHNGFVSELEGLVERHVSSYSSLARQHSPQACTAALEDGGLFRVAEVNAHANPLVLRNAATLCDVLNSQSYVRSALHGSARKAFNSEVCALAQRRFGDGPLLLPVTTRLFILHRLAPTS